MTHFRERDLLKVTSSGAARWNGGLNLTEGAIVRVVEVSPDGDLIKIYSSLLNSNHLNAWWNVDRFELYRSAEPEPEPEPKPELTHREHAEDYLKRAEQELRRYSKTPDKLALVGILHAILDDQEIDAEPLGDVEEEREALRARLDELETEKRSLHVELNAANEARAELRRQLDSARSGNRELASTIDSLREEIARLNREQGVVSTRREALSGPNADGVTVEGNEIFIKDGDGDGVTLELSVAYDERVLYIDSESLSSSGVYITRKQYDTIGWHLDKWIADA